MGAQESWSACRSGRERASRRLTLAALVVICGCPDDEISQLSPNIEADPAMVDFGDGIVGQENLLPLTIKNSGGGILRIDSIAFSASDEVFSFQGTLSSIQPGAEVDLTLVFRPAEQKVTYENVLEIASNDPDSPRLAVPVVGVGGVQEIVVEPLSIDFGVVNEGTAPERTIVITNVGKDLLDVTEVIPTSTSVDLLIVAGSFSGGTLEAGTSTTVVVMYSPVDVGPDALSVEIRSNDEDEPSIVVDVVGRANLAPRAIAWGCEVSAGHIGCEGEEQRRTLGAGLRRLVGLEGREAFDLEGGPVTDFRWQIVERPPESVAAIFHSGDDLTVRARATGDIEIDTVGRFDLRLIVRDDRGLDSLDRPESHVLVLPKDLEVRLLWSIETDADLHVIRPGGRLGDYGFGPIGTSTGTDCSSFNRGPNWGDLMTNADDPRLDRDDVTGTGPEIVSVDAPDATGPHEVYAHYCDSRDVLVSTEAWVEVFVRGQLVQRIPETGGVLLRPDEAWRAATVSWDAVSESATVQEIVGPEITNEPGICRIIDE